MPSGHRPQPPVGTARVAISGTGDAGNPWVNVFWLNLTATSPTAANFTSVLSDVIGAYTAHLLPSVANEWFATQIKGSYLHAAGSAFESVLSVSDEGSAGASPSTDATCSLINWAIPDYYRGGHPRTYLPGTPENQITNGRNLNGTFRSTLATGANAFITAVNAITEGGITAAALGTVRFASGNAWLTPPVFRAFTGASVNPIISTQRRRLAR